MSNLALAQLPVMKIGAEKGVASINGEVEPAAGFAFGFFLEKPLVPAFSIRLYGGMGNMRGQDLNPSQNWLNHPSWNGTLNPLVDYREANANFIFANYQTNYLEAGLQGKFIFTQLPFFKNQSNFDVYLSGGIGLMQFETKIDAQGIDQAIYDFTNILLSPATTTQILAGLNQVQDGNYETRTQAGQQTTPLYQIGAGLDWRVHPSISLSLNYRFSWTNTDVLDSYQWDANNNIDGQNDAQHYTSIGLSYNINKKKIAIPPQQVIDLPRKPIDIPVQPKVKIPVIEVPSDSVVAPKPPEVKIVDLNQRDSVVVRRAFDNLEFETDQATIRRVSFSPLNELASLLGTHPTWKLQISGHTDNTGDPAFNLDLSKRRAEAVRAYLNSRGIGIDRFVIHYYGQTRPIATNATRAGRQRNRRVELLIIE
ncbi:MAG: hypothetical protein Sapg2KO_01520 [Saprospiraceae bacterium]